MQWPGVLGERAACSLLEQVLRQSPADETEAALVTTSQALTRFAHNTIHQNVGELDAELEIRAVFGGRVGMAATNDLSPSGWQRALLAACEQARHLPANADWPGLPRPGDQAPQDALPIMAFDAAVAEATPTSRAAVVRAICDQAGGQQLLASGAFGTSYGETVVANTHGLIAYAPSTEVDLTFVVEQTAEQASAYAHAAGWQLAQLDVSALTSEACRHARAARAPRRLPAGEYPVVLEPYAVGALLEALAEAGMGALAVQEERSWMNGRLGRACLSPELTIWDDAFDPRGVPRAFDCEGVPKRRVPIVLHGTPTSPVYDRLTAAREAGRSSTGHAQPYDAEDWDGPLPENLVVTPGDQTTAELIAAIGRGLYITRFWYVNLVSPHDCAVTGTTRDGVWWIENGQLAFPVANLRFDQALVEALAGVRGVGAECRTVAGFFGGVHRAPALALDSFRFIDPS
ncbi:MAG: TldD/PmbA family protein [Anaerolineales bacterium]|nr:TldD/PmbA family protein [Anaerolineales bacterium]